MMTRPVLPAPERRGAAFSALLAIGAITLVWWALALWPAGSVEPEWLARTRAACFGARRGGLPDAGGWILLVGEPAGLLTFFGLVFGRSLRADLEWIARRRAWRAGAVSLGLLGLIAVSIGAVRIAAVRIASATRPDAALTISRLDVAAPDAPLVDQYGQPTSLGAFRGEPVLLTFAYGHCETVCPMIVSHLMTARRGAHREHIPILILTLDPWRDTPDRLPTLAQHWALANGDRVLSGEIADVNRLLDVLGIGRRRDERDGVIAHGSTVLLLDRRGRVAWRADGVGDLGPFIARI
jgi:protein SCO1/2